MGVNLKMIKLVEETIPEANNIFRKAHFLSQLHEETGNFTVVYENLRYSRKQLLTLWKKYFGKMSEAELNTYVGKPDKIANRIYARAELGNGNEASGDGWKYRGRGYIQLTGKVNYQRFTNFIGEDCIANPDLVATKYPLKSAAHFFTLNKVWEICDHGAQDPVVVSVTKKINGGLINLDVRRKYFKMYYEHFGGDLNAITPLTPTDSGTSGNTDDDLEQPSYEETFKQIGLNIDNIEQDNVSVTWGKRNNESEDCDWISLKQFIMYLASKYMPQGFVPFVELIPEITLNNSYYSYDKDGIVDPSVEVATGDKTTGIRKKYAEMQKKMQENLPSGLLGELDDRFKDSETIISKASGVADLTTIDPFNESFSTMGIPNEGGKNIIDIRKVGVRAFGQLVLSPGAVEGSVSKPGPIGFTDFEIQSGAQCDNGLALITMNLVDVQGNKFTDLASPWSFIYDARPGSEAGDFWFRYGWMLRLPDFYDKSDKTARAFWNHPGWDLFGDKIRFFIINQILPTKPYITLTQSINSEKSFTKNSNGEIIGKYDFYSMFDDGLQYDSSSGEVVISRSNLTDASYVKLSILNPEITVGETGALTAKLSFRTTGSIVHQMPLALAHNLRKVVAETHNLPLGDLLVAYLSDLDSFSSYLDTDATRGKRSYVSKKYFYGNMADTRNFDGFVYLVGLDGGANQGGSIHPDSIALKISKKYRKLLESKEPDNELSIIRWLREVLDDNGCALQSAATGSGAGINSAWIIAVTDDFDQTMYKPSRFRQPETTLTSENENNVTPEGTIGRGSYATETLSLMRSEKDVFSYRFQGSLASSISIEKTSTPNAMSIDANYAVGDMLVMDDDKIGFEKPPVTTSDKQRNLKILFAQMQNVKITALCHPWIGPGKRIFVKGMGFFDGEYMVLSCTHKLSTNNEFITELEGARMLKGTSTKADAKAKLRDKQENGGNQNKSKEVTEQSTTTPENKKNKQETYSISQKEAALEKSITSQLNPKAPKLTPEEEKILSSISKKEASFLKKKILG